jgi:hypothetical protein
MSILSSLAAALLVATAAAPPQALPGPVALPEAVLAHPAAGDLSLQAPPPPRWSAQALNRWPGPWGSPDGLRPRPDSYDYRYVTW